MGYVAEAVRKAGHEVSILDARLERLSPEEVLVRVRQKKPEVVGLSALHMPFEIQGTRELARILKASGQDFQVVLGGPLASTLGEEMVGEGLFDAAIKGEGEDSFNKYLDALSGKDSLDNVPGLIRLRNGEIQANPAGAFVKDIDILVPAWDLINPAKYFRISGLSNFSIIKRSIRCVPVFTSRGCPFSCIYCHNLFGRRFRARSPESVLDEIEMLKREYGVRELEIVDDCFNIDLKRAKAIAKGIIDRKLDLFLTFPNGLRADLMDDELIDLLKEAGTYRIYYAVETATPRLQELIQKRVNLDRTKEVIAYTAGKGILTCGFFMLGFPTETEEEMHQTVQYALDSGVHSAYFFYVSPFPGTDMAKKYPIPEFSKDEIDKMGYFEIKVNMSAVPDETLHKIAKEAYRKIHFTPARLWKLFKVTPKNIRSMAAACFAALIAIRDPTGW
jgi:anaerobic magnesium-protoporphyrin IX monomethyl ester cyclase